MGQVTLSPQVEVEQLYKRYKEVCPVGEMDSKIVGKLDSEKKVHPVGTRFQNYDVEGGFNCAMSKCFKYQSPK